MAEVANFVKVSLVLGVHLLKLRRGWELLDVLCLQPRTCGDVGVIGSALPKFY